MAETYKTEIILRLFQKRWNPDTRELSNPFVTIVEIRQEHEAYRARRGQEAENTNPPAFLKDLLRKRAAANANWPKEVFAAGYTARQVTGGGRNFEFIPIAPGQTEPFPRTVPAPPADIVAHRISSVSFPLASRRLARSDEPTLVQISVRLHVVETYFALFSARKATVRQIDHLQNAVKLRRTEIDAVFLGIEEPTEGHFQEFIVTCEAKRAGEEIISEQVLAQAKAVFTLENVKQPFVVPIALKSIGPSLIHIVEYGEVRREDAEALEALTIVNQAVFELVPAVPGIGQKGEPRRPAKSRPKHSKTRGETAT